MDQRDEISQEEVALSVGTSMDTVGIVLRHVSIDSQPSSSAVRSEKRFLLRPEEILVTNFDDDLMNGIIPLVVNDLLWFGRASGKRRPRMSGEPFEIDVELSTVSRLRVVRRIIESDGILFDGDAVVRMGRCDQMNLLHFQMSDPIVHIDDEEKSDEGQGSRVDSTGVGQMVMFEEVTKFLSTNDVEKKQCQALTGLRRGFQIRRPSAEFADEVFLIEIPFEKDNRGELKEIIGNQRIDARNETGQEDLGRPIEKNEDTGEGEESNEQTADEHRSHRDTIEKHLLDIVEIQSIDRQWIIHWRRGVRWHEEKSPIGVEHSS